MTHIRVLFTITLLSSIPSLAMAYVGPGAGLSAIGSLLALLLAVVVAFIGFFWYPIKRLLGGRKSPTIEDDGTLEHQEQQSADESK